MNDTSEERAARNEAVFRDANEKLRDARVELVDADDRTPFLCECEDPRCTSTMLLTLPEYEQARQSGDWFIVTPEHEERTRGEVIAKQDGFVLVKKRGVGGEVARELHTRD